MNATHVAKEPIRTPTTVITLSAARKPIHTPSAVILLP